MQSQKDSVTFAPIGYLRTVFDNKFGTPRQGALAPNSHASLELVSQWRNKGAFDGIEGFSHLWLVSHFHQSQNPRVPSKIHPPRLEGKSVGVFASRSPHRPNNMGLTLARLERRKGDTLFLSGIDLVDNTPILDIKPYVSEADRPDEFRGGWTDNLVSTPIPCHFSNEAQIHLEQLCQSGQIVDKNRFIALVTEVLALDPRPLSYRERVNEKFAVVLGGMDVHARFHEGLFTIVTIQPYRPASNL